MFLKFNNAFQMNKDIYSLGTCKTLDISMLIVPISLSVNYKHNLIGCKHVSLSFLMQLKINN